VRVVTLQRFVWTHDEPRRRTILLVEDDPFVLDATSRILQSSDFNVLPASDVQTAVKIFTDHIEEIELVMTDMILPGPTGQHLAQHLREQSPTLPVLVTSGYTNPEYEIETPETHTYFLAKPYSKQLLIDKIKKILPTLPLAKAATQSR
jgi:DNA-binding NtrC family response regulator